MVRGADFPTYEPVRFGVSAHPLCVVIKYKDKSTRGTDHKHHLIKLERLITHGPDKLTKEKLLKFLEKHHWQYFDRKVDSRLLETILSKVMLKAAEPLKGQQQNSRDKGRNQGSQFENERADFKRKPEASPAATKPTKGEIDQLKEQFSPSPSSFVVPRRQSIKKEVSIQEEDIEEEFLNSEDLGLESNKYGDIKKSSLLNNNSKPGFDNGSAMKLSDSRISNEPLPVLNKAAKKGKPQEDLKQSTERLKKANKTLSKSDEFQDEFLDGFESVDKRSVTFSTDKLGKGTKPVTSPTKPAESQVQKQKQQTPVQEDDYLGEFDDDFGALDDPGSVSQRSKKKPVPEDDDGFDDLDFEEIPDQVSEDGNKKFKKGDLDDFDDIDIGLDPPSHPPRNQHATFPGTNKPTIDLKQVQTMNLNKLTDEEIAEVKKAMDQNFKALKPNDPGYVYEKNQSFVAEESNDWDD